MLKPSLLFVLVFFTFLSVKAQTEPVGQLHLLKGETILFKAEIANLKKPVNTLTKQLTLSTGQANAIQFENNSLLALNNMVDRIDNMYYHLSQALVLSQNGFNGSQIQQSITNLSAQRDLAQDLVYEIKNLVLTQQKQAALAKINVLNGVITQLTRFNNQVINRNQVAIDKIRPYQVCIRLVDAQGNPTNTSDLFGYYAQNQNTGEYIYPSNQEGTCFTLSSGTYSFGAFPGYWSGASSETRTLSRSQENQDGIVVIDLVLWSE